MAIAVDNLSTEEDDEGEAADDGEKVNKQINKQTNKQPLFKGGLISENLGKVFPFWFFIFKKNRTEFLSKIDSGYVGFF